MEYGSSIGLGNDPFLDTFSWGQCIILMGAFAMALRDGQFSQHHYDTLAEITVRCALSCVASTFRENNRPNPTRDEDGELGHLLSRLYRGFRNIDPNSVQ